MLTSPRCVQNCSRLIHEAFNPKPKGAHGRIATNGIDGHSKAFFTAMRVRSQRRALVTWRLPWRAPPASTMAATPASAWSSRHDELHGKMRRGNDKCLTGLFCNGVRRTEISHKNLLLHSNAAAACVARPAWWIIPVRRGESTRTTRITRTDRGGAVAGGAVPRAPGAVRWAAAVAEIRMNPTGR